MNSTKKFGTAVVAGAIALGTGLGLTYQAAAQQPTETPAPTESTPADPTPSEETAPKGETGYGMRGPGPRGDFAHQEGRGDRDEALAAELGITVEQLRAARATARAAVMTERAPEDSELRGAGRDALKDAYDAALADALGISVKQLQAARDKVEAQTLSDAVAAGTITQQEADAIQARRIMRDRIDDRALVAGVLGMSVEELDQARTDGQRMDELLAAKGMTQESFRAALQAAYEAEIDTAVAEGAITQAQADALKAEGMRGVARPFGRRGHHGRGGPHGDFEGDGSPMEAPAITPDSGT